MLGGLAVAELTSDTDRELKALWLRRADLSVRESEQLYRLVHSALIGVGASHYESLKWCYPGEPDQNLRLQLINDFYTDIVYLRALQPSFQPTPLNHVGALRSYYKNYLIDRIRRCERARKPAQVVAESVAAEARSGHTSHAMLDDEHHDQLETEGADWRSDHDQEAELAETTVKTDSQAESIADDWLTRADEATKRVTVVEKRFFEAATRSVVESTAETLDQARDLEQLRARILPQARAFLAEAVRDSRAQGEAPWVLLYLAHHHCQPDPELRQTMAGLAARYQIRNYNGRARKLGIASAKGGFPSLAAFSQTLLGGWLVKMGIAIDQDNMEEIAQALKILCEVALNEVEMNPL